jgi:hypothetical protein
MRVPYETLQRERDELAARLAYYTAAASSPKILLGEKGGICIYGIGSKPVSLYASQMRRLLESAHAIAAAAARFLESGEGPGSKGRTFKIAVRSEQERADLLNFFRTWGTK